MNKPDQEFLLADLLDVDQLEATLFLGNRVEGASGRVFGGQVLGQALMAAAKTVEPDRLLHSAHNYFIRPGDNTQPIYYQAWLDLDGRSFSNRRVVALQDYRPILNLTCSFQKPEVGLHHQQQAPEYTGPEGLMDEAQLAEKFADKLKPKARKSLNQYRPIEVRPLNEIAHFIDAPISQQQAMWFRAKETLGDSATLHRAILAYATDLGLLSTSGRPHGITWAHEGVNTASIDHALWIHSPNIQANQWMLYTMDSPWTGNARGLNRGSIFSASGELLATVVQEGLIRVKKTK